LCPILSAMDLIVITPEETVEDETEIVNRMFENGLHRLHIRKPLFSAEEYRDYIKAIKKRYHLRLVIHGHFELYKEFWLDGIHLNAKARNDAAVWAQLKDIGIWHSSISTSFHSWQEIVDNEYKYRYVFISPVFDSISKKSYKAGIDLDGIADTKQKLDERDKHIPKIIGLGGVGPTQLKILKEHGFDGAAMLGAIWNSEFSYIMFLDALLELEAL
jgi:thiamine-phosphate pyrophosphorylase